MLVEVGFIGVWARLVKRAESATWVQQRREIFPIHETVTWTDCHRSPAPAVIYWLWNAGRPGEASAFVHRPTHAHLQPLSLSNFLQYAFL